MWKWKKKKRWKDMSEEEKIKQAEEDFARLLPKMAPLCIRLNMDDFEKIAKERMKKDEIILEKREHKFYNKKKKNKRSK